MKKLLLITLFLCIPWSILAEPDPDSNSSDPFLSIEAGLDRNFQATKEIPTIIIDDLAGRLPPPGVGALRWISPNWEQSQSNQTGATFRIRTTIIIFNPDRINPVNVDVRAYLQDGSEFNSGFGVTVPATLNIPPFGQATFIIQDFTGESHSGAVVLQADGPVVPDGEITRRNLNADSGYSRTMVWVPDL